jgi:hypothetical protein
MSIQLSAEAKAQVDALARSRGISKAKLIEEALQFHLLALREIPEDIVVPSRLVVSSQSLEKIAARLAANETPTAALRELMRGEPH